MASAFARGWAAAEFGLSPAAAPNLGPWRTVREGRSSPAGWLRGASPPGPAAGPWIVGPWTAGPGGALLAR